MGKMWFRQRNYGWGWFPITIEGWLSIILFLVGAIYFTRKGNMLMVFVLIISLVILGYLKGPKPKWRWGK